MTDNFISSFADFISQVATKEISDAVENAFDSSPYFRQQPDH